MLLAQLRERLALQNHVVVPQRQRAEQVVERVVRLLLVFDRPANSLRPVPVVQNAVPDCLAVRLDVAERQRRRPRARPHHVRADRLVGEQQNGELARQPRVVPRLFRQRAVDELPEHHRARAVVELGRAARQLRARTRRLAAAAAVRRRRQRPALVDRHCGRVGERRSGGGDCVDGAARARRRRRLLGRLGRLGRLHARQLGQHLGLVRQLGVLHLGVARRRQRRHRRVQARVRAARGAGRLVR